MSKSRSRQVSHSERIANTENDWRKALKYHMDRNYPTVMDWGGFEATLRAYVRDSKDHNLDKIVAEFTGRGYELPCQEK